MRRRTRPGLLTVFAAAAASVLAVQALAAVSPAGRRPALEALAWAAAAAIALGTAVVVVGRTHVPALKRSWILWSAGAAAWLAGAVLRLGAEAGGPDALGTAADVAWLAFPLLAALSIASDAPRGSLSFGLFLLDAVPLVLFLTLAVRFVSPHELDEAHAHELLLIGYPLLYLLVTLIGLQALALERSRLRSPNLWGFAVAQPLLALGAVGWVVAPEGGAGRFGVAWTLGFLAAGICAVTRARTAQLPPRLLPLNESGLRALPPAAGAAGLLLLALAAPVDYRLLPTALAVLGLGCLAARALVVQHQHRRAHASLRESGEKLRTLVANVPGAVYRCAFDGDWEVDFMSEEIESLTGYPAADFAAGARRWASIEHPDDTEALNETIRRQVAAGEPYAFEYRIVRADGELRWVLDRGQAAYDRDGTPLWLDGVLVDVTDRHRARERAERQTELLGLLQRVAVAANEARDADEALQVCVAEVCACAGWPLGHVLVRPEAAGELVSSGLWHADDPAAYARFRAVSEELRFPPGVGLPGRVLASGRPAWVGDVTRDPGLPRGPLAGELGLRSAFAFPVLAGAEIVAVFEFYAPPGAEPDAELLRVVAHIGTVLGRVVERTRAERALASQNEQLRELDGLKDEFVSLVSHELRTPLTSIRGYLELVLEDDATPLADEHRDFLGVVRRNADRLLGLVGDLLFVAQLDAGRLVVERKSLDLATVARECAEAAEPLAAARGVALAVETEPAPLAGDRTRLLQLVENLVSNAVKFTPDGGRVRVRVVAGAGAATLEVADSGIGIPRDEQAQLFERFFRSSNARRSAIPGTGLGLAIVQAIAEAHDGAVAVESREGEGTTFTVRLPAQAAEPALPAGEAAA